MRFSTDDDWNMLNPVSKKEKVKTAKDLLGHQYIVDADISEGTYEFLKEEYEAFGSWCETIPEDQEPGWYIMNTSESWNFEHTDCDMDITFTRIKNDK